MKTFLMGEMATNMKKKFDKYWGKMNNVNQLLLFATILDPRYKLDYVEYYLNDLYIDGEVVSNMMKSLKANLIDIYDWYVCHESVEGSNKVSTEESKSSTNTSKRCFSSTRDARLSRFMEKQAQKDSVEIKNDVERYLLDARESIEKNDFDVVDWWKVNRNKYSVLSNLAKDVLAIQVSTVASESAFSTGGRILDPFHSSLSPMMVKVIICTQNWLKASPNLDDFCIEDVEHYNQMDELLDSMNSISTEDDHGPNVSTSFILQDFTFQFLIS